MFWKVIELGNTIFQDLEICGKGRYFKIAISKFFTLVSENSKYPKMDITQHCTKHSICFVYSFYYFYLKHDLPRNHKM